MKGQSFPCHPARTALDDPSAFRYGALIPFEVGQRSVAMWGRIPLGSGAVLRT